MAATNIDEVFKQIEKDFVELSKTAARNAATKAQKDIAEKADKFIGEYYEYDAKWYKKSRKYALYKLVKKYYQEMKTKKGIMIEFGVQYSPSQIRGIHKSYSPYHQSGNKWISRNDSRFKWDGSDNGIPEPEWITENFLEGIHYVYEDGRKIQDAQSPDEKMQRFFDKELGNLVMTYMNRYLLDSVRYYF
jgi:hypothetical protein